MEAIDSEAPKLNILSLGYNRQLLDGDSSAGDVYERLTTYASLLNRYYILVHARKKHRIDDFRQVKPNMLVYATQGFNLFHSMYRMYRMGGDIIRRESIDVIATQDPFVTGFVGGLLAWRHGLPFSVCVYGSNPYDRYFIRERLLYRLLRFVAIRILHAATGVQVDGNQVRKSLTANGIAVEKIHYKPMIPQNIEAFFNVSPVDRGQIEKDGNQSWNFVFVGRLTYQKNLVMLLRIFRRLKLDGRHFCAYLIGDGPDRSALEQKVREWGLDSFVRLVGKVSHARVCSYLAEADCFVLPSNYEGFPRVLMEAGAVGIPIVATEVSGAEDVILADLTGYVVPIGDEDAFHEALVKTMNGKLGDPLALQSLAKKHILAIVKKYRDLSLQITIWQTIKKQYASTRF